MKCINDYKAVIVDVDGTLYYQKPLRWIMAAKLLLYYGMRPWKWRDLGIIRAFRKAREEDGYGDGELAVLQYRATADALRVSVDRVMAVVEKWIYHAPLPYLRYCKDRELAAWLDAARTRGLLVVAYSDYPVHDKLAALDITVDHGFCATDAVVNCLKPNPRGLQSILSALCFSAEDCLFIGDREEKDGECARRLGMDFLILPASVDQRRRILNAASR